MRAVKIAAVVMAVLIVLGTTVLVVALFKRASAPAVMAATAVAVMDEPAGTGIVSIAAVGDRLAVQLHGGGPDRIVFVDPHNATVAGRISLTK